jgi:glycosyltransferase involved in cell wall biosynthesis
VSEIPVRLGLQQRVLPVYRVPFFESLAGACQNGLGVFAGLPRAEEAIETKAELKNAVYYGGSNRHLFKGFFYLCWQSDVLDWLENWQPDVLVVEANPRYISTPWAIHWMHQRQRPVIGWGLGAQKPTGRFSGFRKRLRRNFVHSFDAVITYSSQGAQEYKAIGFSPENIFIAPNAVALRPRDPLPERPPRFSNGRAVVIFVGRLQERKKVDNLIRACAALPAETQPKLLIVGDGPAKPELVKLSSTIYPETQFLGAQFGTSLVNIFQEADLFVLPGTGGLAVQQAMSFGLPVIVGQADGTQAELVHPENGWQLTDADWPVLSQVIAKALSDIVRLRQMGVESYRLIAEEVNVEKMVDVFAQAVNKVRNH